MIAGEDYSGDVFFSEWFGVASETLENYGALNISVVSDLPMFIDPFLCSTATKPNTWPCTNRSSITCGS